MLDSTTKTDHNHAQDGDPNQKSMHKGAGASDRMTGQEREAIANAIERMVALKIDPEARVYVDDENHLPSYARHLGTAWGGEELDDPELDYAIGWLPSGAFLNDDSPWPGSYNPYLTLNHLRTLEDAK
ncbi:hypothetical protein LIX17_25045 (plasmid) [Mycobacterium avium subsp. hominissuis]|uniref:hypothetical protein n=1 Tax=Mycobacterium avium TaxID=1764 RepID=UPI00314001C9